MINKKSATNTTTINMFCIKKCIKLSKCVIVTHGESFSAFNYKLILNIIFRQNMIYYYKKVKNLYERLEKLLTKRYN